ncbi:hypothetical protein QAD02_010859 [Eretmocerus hayati]|uniref:Uncharacterized protein n=1 Tax=Eretmocerus hayati TaxID=131215 RepID=A0ACC2NW26_9HYME|nr:hypothetical protein QAD02_010859 [Eretmocerus hayati]
MQRKINIQRYVHNSSELREWKGEEGQIDIEKAGQERKFEKRHQTDPLKRDDEKLQRKNPERKAKTNRSTWTHLRRTQLEYDNGRTKENHIPERIKISDDDRHNLQDEREFALLAEVNQDPITYHQAMKSAESLQWGEAVAEEMEAMEENDVWGIVDRPPET